MPLTAPINFEIPTEDVEMVINYLIHQKIISHLKLRRLSNEELTNLLAENYKKALWASVPPEKNTKLKKTNNKPIDFDALLNG